ncbi:B-cell receptor CD22-like [Seriola dumerili]|uniref:B-cell receptor CD22-like n=1 Tax=Seriola dumerili TaxID=41447 RepID=UPI000BBE9421|nr:B-cell receptor CD22-like [Seriola dumerili]
MRIAAQTVVGWLVFLALIKNYSTYNLNPFDLTPSELTAKEGSCAEIKCTVSNTVNDDDGAYWFWMKDGKWNDTGKDFTGTIIYSSNFSRRLVSPDFEGRVKYIGSPSSRWRNSNKQSCSILICDLKKRDRGEYSFRFVGKKKWITKKNVSLNVEGMPPYHVLFPYENPCLLTFQKPPAVNESDTITLTCSTLRSCKSRPQIQDLAQSPQTQFNNVQQNEKSTTVSFTARLQDDGKEFSCQTEDNTDKYSIQNISVTVEYAPKDISAQSTQIVKEGDSVALRCSAKGNPKPNITWFKEKDIQSSQPVWTITSIQESQSGSYYCKAQNKYGTIISKSITITVRYVPRVEIKKTSPMSDVKEGDKMFLICNVIRSYPQPSTYNWFKNGTHIDQKQSYVVETIKPENRGSYTCEATNDVGTGTSKPLLISVQYRPTSTSIFIPDNKVKVGEFLKVTCNTDANPEPHTYSWHRYSQNKQIDSSRWKSSTGHDNSQYLASVQRADEACYTCNATNSIGTGDDSQPVCIDVLYPPTEPTLSMADEVTEGHTVTITCTVESNPPSTLTLRRTSTSNPQFLEIHKSINDQPHVSTLHHFFNVTSADTGSYSCRAVNSEGSKESKQRKLLVKYIPKDVTVKPLSGLIVNENAPLKLSCDAQSYPSVTSFTWRKTDGNHETHQTTQTLTIKSASPSDSGLYSCEATNEIGTGKSQPVQVQIKYGPKHTTITITAAKQERDGRHSMTLTCSSHGYPQVKYSWMKQGKETNKNVANSQNYKVYSDNPGVYYCIAENEMNRKSSDPVHVFDRDLKKILMVSFLCFFIVLIIFSILIVYRHRRKKSIQQGTTNTQPLVGFLGWWNGTRRGNLTNETVLTEPSRSRDDLLPDQPFRPRAQQRQPGPDSTPASNINSVYCTVNLPHGKLAPAAQKPTGQQGGHTQDDSLNYASLHFWNKPNNRQGEAEEDVYTKVSKPKPHQKNEQSRLEDYENFTVAIAPKSPNPLTDDSDTSDDEVDVNYSQVSFKPKPGHQRVDTDSSTSDEDEIHYSDVKV